MRPMALLICCLIFMGNTSQLNVHAKAMALIKKNEGTVYNTYPDDNPKTKRIEYAGCHGNHYDEQGKRFKHITYFTPKECKSIFYTHYFKRTVPHIPKGLSQKKYIAYADLIYQFSHNVLKWKNTKKYMAKFPQRGRLKLYMSGE